MTSDWLEGDLRRLKQDGLLRHRRTIRPLGDGWCEVDGQHCRNFASNDYLNLSSDPRILDAARHALREGGAGATASALVCGRTIWHERLEQTLADFEQTSDAVLFPTGYAANVGTITALIRSTDVAFCDRANHASLIDGVRLSGARMRVYRHDQLERLERELRKARTQAQPAGGNGPRLWIVTDSVFSMDGDLAPLGPLCELAEAFQAGLIVDEAHGTGVFGNDGRGACELAEVESRITVRVGTLSKAVGCLGGFVACDGPLREWLWNSARTQMFSTALPPGVCAAACESVKIIRSDPGRRKKLHALSRRLTSRLRSHGLKIPDSVAGPIIPVPVGDPESTVRAAERLLCEGLLVGAIRPPTVPRDTGRLRLCVSTAFEIEDIDVLADSVAACLNESIQV